MSTLNIDSKVIGQRLRELRGKKSMDIVADDTGISRSALNMYELGERIPRDKVKVLLSEYYGVGIEELFFSGDGHNK